MKRINIVFHPVADAYVISTYPDNNFGTKTYLYVDHSPDIRSYLRFEVSGLNTDDYQNARLRIYARSHNSTGVTVSLVPDNNWDEKTITFNNSPAIGETINLSKKYKSRTWIEVDLSNVISGEGIYTLAITTTSDTNTNFASRESERRAPQLVFSNDIGSVPTAETPTGTATPVLISTNTPTTQNTNTPSASLTNTQIVLATNTPTITPSKTSTATFQPSNTTAPTSTSTPIMLPTNTPTVTRTNTRTATITNTPTKIITSTSTPSGVDPVLVGAGDIASCSSTGDEATANLIDSISGTVFTAGDNVYESGTATEFTNCYNPTWGRFKLRTRPAPGNHEYNTTGASGYYGYFGSAAGDPSKGYYSYDLGDWHIVVLNSQISTSTGSTQETWLRQDLANNPSICTLAYWHYPLFSSSSTHGSISSVKPLYQALYDYHADVVINGNDHTYERFAPQSPIGVADPNGIVEFVAGMGGRSHYGFGTILPNSVARNGDTYGVLKFTLHAESFDWQFVPVAGKTYTDSGTALCVP